MLGFQKADQVDEPTGAAEDMGRDEGHMFLQPCQGDHGGSDKQIDTGLGSECLQGLHHGKGENKISEAIGSEKDDSLGAEIFGIHILFL